jgi:hypothetical protein
MDRPSTRIDALDSVLGGLGVEDTLVLLTLARLS